ncbi:hypothetical protein C0993_010080 [Termitomyces sp. T159_Od127]|nr:hypothetical protein C0993_010080 [Termitomyces sp. T159_Od127]
MRALPPRPLPRILLLGLMPVAAWFIVRPLLDPVPPLPALYTSVGFSIFAFLATTYLIPALGPSFVKAGLRGGDLLKPYRNEIPMSTGEPGTRMRVGVHLASPAVYSVFVLQLHSEFRKPKAKRSRRNIRCGIPSLPAFRLSVITLVSDTCDHAGLFGRRLRHSLAP